MDSLKSGTPAWQFQAVRSSAESPDVLGPAGAKRPKQNGELQLFLIGFSISRLVGVYLILAVGVSKEPAPNMSACTACKWISSLPVFCRNAFIKGPQVRSGKKRWDWTMGDLAHKAGAWLGIVGCSDQASDSGILWLSIVFCMLLFCFESLVRRPKPLLLLV